MKRFVFLVVLLVAVSTHADERCSFPGIVQVKGELRSPQEYTLSWAPVPDARIYIIEETVHGRVDGRYTVTQILTNNPTAVFKHESINDVTYEYRIRALTNTSECQNGTTVKTFGDVALRRAVARGIAPVVGSTRGANGSLFKTYLKLEGVGLKGRVIFHPMGRAASDDDPSLAYDLMTNRKLEWDDIVASLGQAGVGSLSILPDADSPQELPTATIRLYNEASNGIFGTNADLYPGIEFLDHTPAFQRIDVPADGNFRLNVGARAILDGTARAIAVSAEGLAKKTVDRTFRAGEMIMGSPEAVFGVSVEPGESLIVTYSRAIIPFYTLTDNRTNDPFLYVQGAERESLVEAWTK